MNDSLISVIVPVYNAEKYLNCCIESIVNQTYQNLEIILVDDGSPDNCSQICDEWSKKDSRIKVIHKENGGVSSARNAGLDIAAGEYIGFIDSDDRIDLDFYKTLYCELLEAKADAARCGIDRTFGDGRVENWGSSNTELKTVSGKQVIKDVAEANGVLPVHTGNKLFKKQCIGDIRFDTRFRFAEDTLFNFTVAQNIKTMVYHDINRYHYTYNEDSVTSKRINENNFDEHRVMDIIFSLADEETLPYCVKGDVLKSFRTIRQIAVSGLFKDRLFVIRKRIIRHTASILCKNIYSMQTKLRTLCLLFTPHVYCLIINIYSSFRYKNK